MGVYIDCDPDYVADHMAGKKAIGERMEGLRKESDESLATRFAGYLEELPRRVIITPPTEGKSNNWSISRNISSDADALLLTIGERLIDKQASHPTLEAIRDAFLNNYETYCAFEDGWHYHAVWGPDYQEAFGDFSQRQWRVLDGLAPAWIKAQTAEQDLQTSERLVGVVRDWALGRKHWNMDVQMAVIAMDERTDKLTGRGAQPSEFKLMDAFHRIASSKPAPILDRNQEEDFRSVAKTILHLRTTSTLGFHI